LKNQTKRYILFFILAFLALRLPSIIAPRGQEFLLKRLVDLAKDNGIGIGILELNYESFKVLNAKGVSIKIKDRNNSLQSYKLDDLRIEFKSFFPPKIDLTSILYAGSLNCTANSKSFLSLIREKSAVVNCNINDFNLQLFPVSGKLNILGKAQISLDLQLDPNPIDTVGDAVIRIAGGYIDTSKLISSPLLKLPPITEVDLFARAHVENNLLNIQDVGFKSNLGLIKGIANIKFNERYEKILEIDTNGTFELSGEGQELISPWIPLINNGKKIEGANGSFYVKGAPYRLKVRISE